MFALIPSLDVLLQCLLSAFTQPSFQTHCEIFLGWLMCLSRRPEFSVFQTIQADTPVNRKKRHPFDRHYNFFSRSAWAVADLARCVAVQIVVCLNPTGLLYLVVDDTLLHKRGKHVYGLGWFRDAVASTAKRVATASGNHWVVMGLAICIPKTDIILCLPIHCKLHLPGKGQLSEAALAREMVIDVRSWFPDRQLVLVGDGVYANERMFSQWSDLDEHVKYVGMMRCDAALYDPVPPKQPKGKRGPKPKKGRRLPSPKEAAKKADRAQRRESVGLANGHGNGLWSPARTAGGFVPRRLADRIGLGADLCRGGARPARQVRRRLPVHDRCRCQAVLGDCNICSTMVDRGRIQGQQAADENRVASTLVRRKHQEVDALGMVDAGCGEPVVLDRRSQNVRNESRASPHG